MRALLAALVWGIFGNRRRRATVAGPIVERAEGLPYLGPRLYSFFSGTMMREVYRAVAEDLLTQAKSGELLEIGAGAGYLAVEVAKRNRNIPVTAMNRTADAEQLTVLITAMVMLKSPLFSRYTAIVGIVLGFMSLLPPTAGMTGMIFALGSLVPLEIWDLMVGIKLFKLANEKF